MKENREPTAASEPSDMAKALRCYAAGDPCPKCGEPMSFDEGQEQTRDQPGQVASVYCPDCGTGHYVDWERQFPEWKKSNPAAEPERHYEIDEMQAWDINTGLRCLRAVDQEPGYTEELPDDVYAAATESKALLVATLNHVVEAAKRHIRERIIAQIDQSNYMRNGGYGDYEPDPRTAEYEQRHGKQTEAPPADES